MKLLLPGFGHCQHPLQPAALSEYDQHMLGLSHNRATSGAGHQAHWCMALCELWARATEMLLYGPVTLCKMRFPAALCHSLAKPNTVQPLTMHLEGQKTSAQVQHWTKAGHGLFNAIISCMWNIRLYSSNPSASLLLQVACIPYRLQSSESSCAMSFPHF